MSIRYLPLTPRQLKVLQWIADGCPDDAWPNDSHKISARALETRNLATVSRPRGRWHAAIKPDGAHYLAHGHYPHRSPAAPHPRQRGQRIPKASIEVDVDDLIARLRASGPIEIEAPAPSVRAAYRRAINAAITAGKVPAGVDLRHTGRDHGDLVITLVEQPRTPKPAPIMVPLGHDSTHPAIRNLLTDASSWAVSPPARPRALTLIQALADEAARRGHLLGVPHSATSTFRIDIGQDSFAFLLIEEYDKDEQIPQEHLDAPKYSWQRVRLESTMIPSGRLALELQRGWRHPRWADRRRWRLDDKLPVVMELIEQYAAEARQQREDAAAERIRRRAVWEQAIPQARERYAYDLNAERLIAQAHASATTAEILAYCRRLGECAAAEPDAAARLMIEEWADWARAHAKAIDPLSHIDDLRHVQPADSNAETLDRYMPDGMTVRHPPD